MYTGKLVFAQVMDHLPMHTLRRCIERYDGNRRVRRFSCHDQFRSMAFAQLTSRESLRDIETCLRAQSGKLYHMGFRGPVSRTTLAKANERRDWRIHADFAQSLIRTARDLHADDSFGVDLGNAVYALDSTTIDLCLSVFPWAHFRRTKAAVKMHTLLDLRGNIPTFIDVSPGRQHDVNVLDDLIPEAGAFYVMDRAYVDFSRFQRLDQAAAFFVTRAKSNFRFRRQVSRPVDKSTGLRCDQTVALTGFYASRDYPGKLRRIKFRDTRNGKELVFLTNNFDLPAMTVAELYKSRWQVELFFKWIKQHLRIKSFLGTSENAVKSQIWIAVSVYVLVAIIRKRLNSELSLYTILQILDVTLFEKTPLNQLLTDSEIASCQNELPKQLNLFDF